MAGKVGQKRGAKQAPVTRKRSKMTAVVIDNTAPTKRVTRGRAKPTAAENTEDEEDADPDSSPANQEFKLQMAQLAKSSPASVLDHKKFAQALSALETPLLTTLTTARTGLATSRSAQALFYSQALSQITPSNKSDYPTFIKEALAPLHILAGEIRKDQEFLDDYVLNKNEGKRVMRDCSKTDMETFLKERRDGITEGYKGAIGAFEDRVERLRDKVEEGARALGAFYEVMDREV